MGASVGTAWLQMEGAFSDAVGERASVGVKIFSFGIGGSALSTSATGGETLNRHKDNYYFLHICASYSNNLLAWG